jgi:Glycosyl transferase family 11
MFIYTIGFINMLVISAKSGKLGNRLFLFANFIAFAIENDLTVSNPAFEDYAEYFRYTTKDILCLYPTPRLKFKGNKWLRQQYYNLNRYLARSSHFCTINIQRNKPFNWSNYNIQKELNLNKINFFQGWLFRDGWFVEDIPNFKKHRNIICNYFQPIEKHQLNINNLIFRVRQQAKIVIGVHIRQGDYQQHQNGRYFYSIEDYAKIMKLVTKLFPEKQTIFFICSNVKQDYSNYFHDISYALGNHHIVEDMYCLAECDYIIAPPSSYSMWSSFYGDVPLYMIRDINKSIDINDFVNFYQWKGKFHSHEDWSKTYWEWTH